MDNQSFDFEKPIAELKERIEALRLESGDGPEAVEKIKQMENDLKELQKKVYGNLTSWQHLEIARHLERPQAVEIIEMLFTDFMELHGDRNFGDDPAVVCGIARFEEQPVALIGQQKGKNTKDRVARYFGMMHPEGFRKAMRVMRLAERQGLPIITLIDTPGAYPGVEAEERGQFEAIAQNIMGMFSLRTPIIGAILGEGFSGGAIGIGVVDYLMIFEHAVYSVCTPEACAAIILRDDTKIREAAEALKFTTKDHLQLQIIDEAVREPLGGAHRNPKQAAEDLRRSLRKQLKRLTKKKIDELLQERFEKYRSIGVYLEN